VRPLWRIDQDLLSFKISVSRNVIIIVYILISLSLDLHKDLFKRD